MSRPIFVDFFVFEKITHFLCISSNKIDPIFPIQVGFSKISPDCISCFLKNYPVFLKDDLYNWYNMAEYACSHQQQLNLLPATKTLKQISGLFFSLGNFT